MTIAKINGRKFLSYRVFEWFSRTFSFLSASFEELLQIFCRIKSDLSLLL